MAVTGQEAAEAIKEGEALANQLAAAQKLQGQALEQEVAALKQIVDPSNIPAALKASLRDQLAGLQKQVLEGQKKASAANKQRATQVCSALLCRPCMQRFINHRVGFCTEVPVNPSSVQHKFAGAWMDQSGAHSSDKY